MRREGRWPTGGQRERERAKGDTGHGVGREERAVTAFDGRGVIFTTRGGGDIRGPYTPFPPALPACSPHEGLTEQRQRDTVEHAIEDVFESKWA